MKHLVACLIALVVAGAILVGQEPPKPEPAVLKARIVQLEKLLREAKRDNEICGGWLKIYATSAAEQKAAEADNAKLAESAKEMACERGVDWTVNPPACRPSK